MDLIQISNEILNKINQLESGRKIIIERAKKKAETLVQYEKMLAIIIVKLRQGEKYELPDNDGKLILIDGKGMPANLIEKVAKGICGEEKLEMEIAEAGYKSAIINMSSLEAQLNGYQSLNRYLKDV